MKLHNDPRFQELSCDPYQDGIAQQIASSLKKRGIKVRSKEGLVRRAGSFGWEVRFPEGTVEANYSYSGKSWVAGKWNENK